MNPKTDRDEAVNRKAAELVDDWVEWLAMKIEITYEGDSYLPTNSESLRYRYEMLRGLEVQLLNIGEPAVSPLLESLKHEDRFVREESARVIAAIEGQRKRR